jgi:hypothetical protein
MDQAVSRRRVDKVLDLVVCVAVCVFAVAVVRYVQDRVTGGVDTENVRTIGSSLAIPGLSLGDTPKTVIIALQAECEYCDASMSFYRDLAAVSGGRSFQIVAVVPHAAAAGSEMLKAAGVDIPQVVRADFGRLRISATPTVILADRNGTVQNVWIGKLASRTEDLIFAKLGVQRPARSATAEPADRLREVREMLDRGVPVIDTRIRAQFVTANIAGSVNIPLDEIEMRLLHEVPRDRDVLVYCDYQPRCPVVLETGESESVCERAVKTVQAEGFTKARLLSESMTTLALARVLVNHDGQ